MQIKKESECEVVKIQLKKTQKDWVEYFNNKGEKMISAADIYRVAKEGNIRIEMDTVLPMIMDKLRQQGTVQLNNDDYTSTVTVLLSSDEYSGEYYIELDIVSFPIGQAPHEKRFLH